MRLQKVNAFLQKIEWHMSKLSASLRIKENTQVLALEAPANYEEVLGELPPGAKITYQLKDRHDHIHLFVRTKSDLEEILPIILEVWPSGGLLWVSFPKAASKQQQDLTRDKGWDCLFKLKIRWVAIAAYDAIWTCYGFINLPKKEQSKTAKEYVELAKIWTDPATKEVKVPDDVYKAFAEEPKLTAIFNSLTFAQRKEFILWIVIAKGADTRERRIRLAVEKLLAGKRNILMK